MTQGVVHQTSLQDHFFDHLSLRMFNLCYNLRHFVLNSFRQFSIVSDDLIKDIHKFSVLFPRNLRNSEISETVNIKNFDCYTREKGLC